MVFLVLLITFVFYKFLGIRTDRYYDGWFFSLRRWFDSHLSEWPVIAMLFLLLMPLLCVYFVLSFFQDWVFGLVGIALHVVILFYALGRSNLLSQIQTYLEHWRQGDIQSSYRYAVEYFRLPQEFNIDDIDAMQKHVRAGLIYQWFEQVFVVIFWYLLAGPLAALFVRLLCMYEQTQVGNQLREESAPLQLQHAIEWLPTRILGFTFAVAGNFTLCFKEWLDAVLNWNMPTQDVLQKSGMAALGVCMVDSNARQEAVSTDALISAYADELETIQDLIIRSLVVWIIAVALFTLF